MAIPTCKNVTTDHAKPLKVLFYWLVNREEKWANTYGGKLPAPITNIFNTYFWLPKQGKGGEVEIRVEKRKTKMRPWQTWGLLSQLCNENVGMCWGLSSTWSSGSHKVSLQSPEELVCWDKGQGARMMWKLPSVRQMEPCF